MTESQAKRRLARMLRTFTIGSVLHLLADVCRERASARKDDATRRQLQTVANTLFVVGLGVDAASPR